MAQHNWLPRVGRAFFVVTALFLACHALLWWMRQDEAYVRAEEARAMREIERREGLLK